MSFTIETDRLELRYLRPGDLTAMTSVWGDRVVAQFMGDYGPRTPDEVAQWLDGQAEATEPPERTGAMNLAARRTSDAVVVSWIGLGTDDRGIAEWDFGYITHPEHRGRGYATEALGGAIGYCFDVLGIESLWGPVRSVQHRVSAGDAPCRHARDRTIDHAPPVSDRPYACPLSAPVPRRLSRSSRTR